MFYISGVCDVEILYGERGEFRRFSSFRVFICQAKGLFVSLPETYDEESLLRWPIITCGSGTFLYNLNLLNSM